ncbi:hypothetical protein PVIIG_00907 [Plasmodium vivax India VII]|uniref:Uncharacterized protein n=1 Tax=Plasmodium vivax India VII TaxID=1077284 RepID=A0A0J9V181_PLAVI|nr:hypothetical protein PVIIG_00907 [Plasmodium vivax India VII]
MENVCKEQGKEELFTIDLILTKYEQYVSGAIRNEELRRYIERFMFQYNCLDECEKKIIEVIKRCENFECKKFQAYYLFITNIVKEICHMELIPIIYNEILEERNAKSEASYLSRDYYIEVENQKDAEENFKAICQRVYKKYILVFIKLLYYSSNLPPHLMNNLISALSCVCILISKYDTFSEPNEKFSELIYRIFWNYFSKSFDFQHENCFSLEENDNDEEEEEEEDDTSSSYYSELLNEDGCFPYAGVHQLFGDKRRRNSVSESADGVTSMAASMGASIAAPTAASVSATASATPAASPIAVSASTERESNNLQKRKKRRERKIPEKSKDAKGESCASEQVGENVKKADDPFFAGHFPPAADGQKRQGDPLHGGDYTIQGVNSAEGCLPVESSANCEIENAGDAQTANAVELSETYAKVNKRLHSHSGDKEKKKIKRDNEGAELANSSTLLNAECTESREHSVVHSRDDVNISSNHTQECQTVHDVDEMVEGERKDADAAPSTCPSLHWGDEGVEKLAEVYGEKGGVPGRGLARGDPLGHPGGYPSGHSSEYPSGHPAGIHSEHPTEETTERRDSYPSEQDLNQENVMFVNVLLNVYVSLFNTRSKKNFLFYRDNQVAYNEFLLDNVEVVVDQMRNMLNKIRHNLGESIVYFLRLKFLILLFLIKLAKRNSKGANAGKSAEKLKKRSEAAWGEDNQQGAGRGAYMNGDGYAGGHNYASGLNYANGLNYSNGHGYDVNFGSYYGGGATHNCNTHPNDFQNGYPNIQESDCFPVWRRNESAEESKIDVDPLSNSSVMNNVDAGSARSSIGGVGTPCGNVAGYDVGVGSGIGSVVGSDVASGMGSLYPNGHSATYADDSNSTPTVGNNVNENGIDVGNVCENLSGEYNCGMTSRNPGNDCMGGNNQYSGAFNAATSGNPDDVIILSRYAASCGSQEGVPNITNDGAVGGTNEGTSHFGKDAPASGKGLLGNQEGLLGNQEGLTGSQEGPVVNQDGLANDDTYGNLNPNYCNGNGEGAYSIPNYSPYGAYYVQNDPVSGHCSPGIFNGNDSATGMNDIFLSNMKNNLFANVPADNANMIADGANVFADNANVPADNANMIADGANVFADNANVPAYNAYVGGVPPPGQGYPYHGGGFPLASKHKDELGDTWNCHEEVEAEEGAQLVEVAEDEEEEERRKRKREIEAEWEGELIGGNDYQMEYVILNRDFLRNSVKKSTFEIVKEMINNLYSNSFLEMLDVLVKCVEVNFTDENLTIINRIFSCMLKGIKYCNEMNKYKIYMFILSKIDKLIKSKRYEENNSTLNNYSCYFLLNLIFNLFKRDKRRKRRNIWYLLFEIHVNKMKRKKISMKVNSLKGDEQSLSMYPPHMLDVNDYLKKSKSKNSEFATKMFISSLIRSNEKNKHLRMDQMKSTSVSASENENDLMSLCDGKNFLINNIINFLLECCISKGCIVRFMSLRIFYMMTILFIEFIKNRSLSYEEKLLKNYLMKSIYQNFFLCIFNILKEPETNIFIYMKFRNLCVSLLFICSKILSSTFLNEFYDKVISYHLCCVDYFYRCKESVCLTDKKGDHYDDGTLRSIYSTFLSNAKDLYLFAFLMLFKNCRNIMNFKILKGILRVSSEEVKVILGSLLSPREGDCSERQDRQERKDTGGAANGMVSGMVSCPLSDDVIVLSADAAADTAAELTADPEGELQNGGGYPGDAKEPSSLRRRKESSKVEPFRVKNINMSDFLTNEMQIKLKIKEQNEEEKKKTTYKNLYFINIFYIAELKKLGTFDNNFVYYMFNCVFCFLNIYINRFTFFFYFIKNEGNHRSSYLYADHFFSGGNSGGNSGGGNNGSGSGSGNKDAEELGETNEHKHVLEFILEMLTLFRNFLHIVAVMEENLINVNVESLVKKKTRGSELTNIRSLKRLVIQELQKFYFIFVKLLKVLFLLNKINGHSITSFEYFFFKLIQSLDNELIEVNTKRHILKFLKYFSYKKKFKDTIISRINHFHSKVRSKRKKISDIFSKKECKRQELFFSSIRRHDLFASNSSYNDDRKGEVNGILGRGQTHPFGYDNSFKAEGEDDEEVEEPHVDAPQRVREPTTGLPPPAKEEPPPQAQQLQSAQSTQNAQTPLPSPEAANQNEKRKSTRKRSGNNSRRSKSNSKKGQPGANNSEEATAAVVEAAPKEEDPSAKNDGAGEDGKTENQRGNAIGGNVTTAEGEKAALGTCVSEAKGAEFIEDAPKSVEANEAIGANAANCANAANAANGATAKATASRSKRRKCSSTKKDEAKVDIDTSRLIGAEQQKEEAKKTQLDPAKICQTESEVKVEQQAEVENPPSNTAEQETRRSRYGRKSGVNTKEKNFSLLIEEEHEQKRKNRRMSRSKASSAGDRKGRSGAKKEEEVKGVVGAAVEGATPTSEFLGGIPGGAPSRDQPQVGSDKIGDNNNNEGDPAKVTTDGFFPEEAATQKRETSDILADGKNASTENKAKEGGEQNLEHTNEKSTSLKIILNCNSNMIAEMDRLNYFRKYSALSSYKDYKVEKFFYDNLELFLLSIFIFEKSTKLNSTDFFLENFDKINEVIEFCKRHHIDRGIEKIIKHLFCYLSEIKNNKKYIHGMIKLITNTFWYIPVYKISQSPFFFISFCCLFKHSKKKHVNKIIIQNFIIICLNYIDTLRKRTYTRRRSRMWIRSLHHRRSEQVEQRTTEVEQNYNKFGAPPVEGTNQKVFTPVGCSVDQAVAGSVGRPGLAAAATTAPIAATDGAVGVVTDVATGVVTDVTGLNGPNGVTPGGGAEAKEQTSKSSRSKKGGSRSGASRNSRSRRNTKKGEEAAAQAVTSKEGGTNQVAAATVATQGMTADVMAADVMAADVMAADVMAAEGITADGMAAKPTSNYHENNCKSARTNSGSHRVSSAMSGVAPSDYFPPREALLIQRSKREEKEITDKLLLNLINLYINFMCSFYFYYLTFYEDNYNILKNILFLGIDKVLQKKANKKLTSFVLSFMYILICLLLKVKVKEEFILTLSREKANGQKEMRRSERRRSEKREFRKKVEHTSGKSRSSDSKISDSRGTTAVNDQREREEEKKFVVKYLINLIDEKKQRNVNQISKKKFRKNIKQVLSIKNGENLENYSYFPKGCFYKNKMDKHIEKVFQVKQKKKLIMTSSLNLKENLKKLNNICVNFSYKFIFTLLSEPLAFEKSNEWLISRVFKKDMKKDTNYAKYNFLDYIIYSCFYTIFCKTELIKMVKTNYQRVSPDPQNSKKGWGNIKMKSYVYNQKKYSTLQFYLAVEILNLIFNNLKYLPFSSIKLIIDIFLNRSFLTVWIDGKKEEIVNKFQRLFHNFFSEIFYLQSERLMQLPYFMYQYQKSVFLVNLVINSVVCTKKKPADNFLLLDILKHCFPRSDLDYNNSSDKKNEDKRGVERSHRMLRSKKVNLPS